MFILHFNRLIRNKWVWGAFAIAISAFFVLSDVIDNRSGSSGRQEAGSLDGEPVDIELFDAIRADARGRGRMRDDTTPQHVVNRSAWETVAALRTAKSLGLGANAEEVRENIIGEPYFRGAGGAFDFRAYSAMLAENGLNPELYEASLGRMLALRKLTAAVAGSASWVSPIELRRAYADETDMLSVRVVTFTDKAKAPELDDAALEKYYNAHTNSLALPDLVSVRYVRFPIDNEAAYSKMAVSDDELHDYFDVVGSRYETETTNGVVRKTFDEVKPELTRELQQIALLDFYATNLPFRVFGDVAVAADDGSNTVAKASKLDEIAAAEGLTVSTSPRFGAEGSRMVPHLMSSAAAVAPGTEGFAAAAFELDPSAEELRYGIVRGTNAVYLIERAKFEPAHVPSFAEAKGAIRADAVAAAKDEAFKAAVEAVVAPARKALAAGGAFDEKAFGDANVSTGITFSADNLSRGAFPDAFAVAAAATKVAKGGLSEFTPCGLNRAVVVYVADRTHQVEPNAEMVKSQQSHLRDQLAYRSYSSLMADWRAWNLDRLGFQPGADAYVEDPNASALPEE